MKVLSFIDKYSHKHLERKIFFVIFLVAIFSGVVFASAPPPIEKEDVINSYISYLASGGKQSVRNGNTIYCKIPGMGTSDSVLPNMTLEEAESAGAYSLTRPLFSRNNNENAQYVTIADQQHNLVIEQFGDDAWENVSYELEEIEPLTGITGYRVISTGEIIDQKEYERLLFDYWSAIAKKEGVSYYDIFLREDEPVENVGNKRTDLIAKYVAGIPVEITTVSEFQTYNVNLSFNNSTTSAEQYQNFHFVIDNSSGDWLVFQGLTWLSPYPEFPIDN